MAPKGFVRKDPPSASNEQKGSLMRWSYSQWSDYEKCPHKVFLKQIAKAPEVGDRAALDRGIAAHTNCEDAVNTGDLSNLLRPVPGKATKLATWQQKFVEIIERGAGAERAIALTRQWTVTTWKHANAWLRGKLDAAVTDKVIDYKTGRKYPEHALQADLYATMMFAEGLVDPSVEKLGVEFWYIDLNGMVDTSTGHWSYPRAEQEQRITVWEHRIAPMMSDTIFPKRPGQHCNWCGFAGSKGGPCDAG